MSIIVPAGKKNVVWSPAEKKETTLVKTAQTDECGVCGEESDPLFDAAKQFADQAGKPEGVVEVETVGGEKAEQEGKTELKEAVEEVKQAVEKVEVAVEKVEGAEEAEVEVEVGDKADEEVEIEVEDVPGEQEVSSGEVIVTSEPEKCACAAKEEVKEEVKEVKEAAKEEKCDSCKKTPCECKKDDKEEKKDEVKAAAVEEEFCRFGKLSPVNKKKVADYWVNALGFPKDYVALMVKDYEK